MRNAAMNDPDRLRVSARWVDARGRACPVPIIELARALKSEAEVELWADDPAAEGDLVAFAQSTGARIEVLRVDGGRLRAVVRRR